MKKELSLYIHIPFCNSRCNYCNFVSFVASEQEKIRYVECLKKEIMFRAKEYNKFFTIKTIFIGGGTPSCLRNGAIKDILQTVYKHFTVKNDAEISIELNPNTATKEKIEEFVISGVNRFSIGLQCISPLVLKNMGRTHTLDDFNNAVSLIREQGVSNINADMIVGYPGQSEKDTVETAKYLVSKNIPHVSAYILSVEQGTPLQFMIDNGTQKLPKEEKLLKTYQAVVNTLSEAGYIRYEVSNFAKPGFVCKHNLTYWTRNEYLGLGVSAHSYIDGVRFFNTENLQSYCQCIETKNKAPVSSVTKLTTAEKKEEAVMLSLRTNEGLSTKAYEEEFHENFLAKHKDQLASFIKLGFLTIDREGNIKATAKGYLVLNKLILELCS